MLNWTHWKINKAGEMERYISLRRGGEEIVQFFLYDSTQTLEYKRIYFKAYFAWAFFEFLSLSGVGAQSAPHYRSRKY